MGPDWQALTVAGIAGAVSIAAAIVAFVQARKASHSAALLDSRAHRIARIDSQIDELRSSYQDFMRKFGDMKTPDKITYTAAELEVLAATQGASPELIAAADTTRDALFKNVMTGKLQDFHLDALREAYRSCQKRLADKREGEAADKR
jgi:hypothetical protein